MHQLAFLASAVGLAWMVREAHGWQAMLSAWVYGGAALLLYLTSSSYHVFARSPRARYLMRRADHAMIYVLIAGTFTPICILGVTGTWRWWILGVVWVGAAVGVVVKLLALDRFPKLGSALYIVLGWAGILLLPPLAHQPGRLALIVAAGVLYTTGALFFALRWPRLHPAWFGYHEVWHVMGVAAGVLFFVVNFGLVSGASP
jgi:hemolysin III